MLAAKFRFHDFAESWPGCVLARQAAGAAHRRARIRRHLAILTAQKKRYIFRSASTPYLARREKTPMKVRTNVKAGGDSPITVGGGGG